MLKAKALAARALAIGTAPPKRTANVAFGPTSAPAASGKVNKKLSESDATHAIAASANAMLRKHENDPSFEGALSSIIGGSTMRTGLAGIPDEAREAFLQLGASTGFVDAAGTTDPNLQEPPPRCMRAVRAVRGQLEDALASSVNDVMAGGGFLGHEAASRLVKMAMLGDIQWDEAVKIAKSLRASSAVDKGVTHVDIMQTWEILEPLMRLCYVDQFGVADASGAISALTKRVGSSARYTGIMPGALVTYVKRVLESWKRSVAAFRRGEAAFLLLSPIVEFGPHVEYYNNEALTARISKATIAANGGGGGGGGGDGRTVYCVGWWRWRW